MTTPATHPQHVHAQHVHPQHVHAQDVSAPATRPVISNSVIDNNSVIDDVEEYEMGKRNKAEDYYYEEAPASRGSGGGRWLLLLIVLVGGVYVVHTGSAYLANFVPVAAVPDLIVGAWAVGGLLVMFFAWCFLSGGSKGGRG